MEETGSLLPITRAVLAMVFSYLVGAIPMGLIVARVASGIDIREHGSGNIGLTNVIRTLGWGPGLITGILDFLKGYLPVLLSLIYFNGQLFGGVAAVNEAVVIMVAATVIIGNMYPVYLLFKGGKGVATGLGVMSALLGVYIFIPLAVFGLFLLAFRYVSLSSMFAAISVPLTVLVLAKSLPFMTHSPDSESAFNMLSGFTWMVTILIIWKHRLNIMRILAGTEPRVGRIKESQVPTLSERIVAQQNKVEDEGASGQENDLRDINTDGKNEE